MTATRSAAELRDTLKLADSMITDYRAKLDNLARGREYKKLADEARKLAGEADLAQSANLDLQVKLAEEAKGR